MNSQDFHSLQEAYMEVVENQQLDEAYQEPRLDRKAFVKKANRKSGFSLGTREDPHGWREPEMEKVAKEYAARTSSARRAKRTGKPDTYRAEKEAQSKLKKEQVDNFDEGYKIRNAAKVDDKVRSLRSKGDLESLGRAGDIIRKLTRSDASNSQLRDREEKFNKTRANKRSKLVSDNNARKKSFPNRLRRSDGQGIRDSYEYDLYDIILSHLLDEGYAETPEAAEAIMVNMSEEWRQSIIG